MSAHSRTPGIHLQNIVLDERFAAEQKAECVSNSDAPHKTAVIARIPAWHNSFNLNIIFSLHTFLFFYIAQDFKARH